MSCFPGTRSIGPDVADVGIYPRKTSSPTPTVRYVDHYLDTLSTRKHRPGSPSSSQ